MIRFVVGEGRKAEVARAEDVGHLVRTLGVAIEELRHVEVMIARTNQAPLVVVIIPDDKHFLNE